MSSKKYISILGRQPIIGIAELERLYGSVRWFSPLSAIVESRDFDFNRLGGSQKAGVVVAELRGNNWHNISRQVVKAYESAWSGVEHKITLGISVYGFDDVPSREVQQTGIILKKKLRSRGVSLRLLPNSENALNTATSHHNKLGLSDNKVELLIVKSSNDAVIVAESVGAQNITALARRDQERPKRDAFVGMLPPKLAQIIVNLGVGEIGVGDWDSKADTLRVLDPFCGTGVVLQEAALMGYSIYGTDNNPKMIDYSEQNIDWLAANFHLLASKSSTPNSQPTIALADAMTAHWQSPIDVVATETYLGQPFSAPPSPPKLAEVRGNCENIIRSFLQNIGNQIEPGAPLCVAIPAWKDVEGNFTHLPLTRDIETLGYKRVQFSTINPKDLLYHRDDQVVARELLVLIKA